MTPVEVPNRIGGELLKGSGSRFERHDPARPDRLVSTAPESTEGEVADAVTAAVEAGPAWAASSPSERAQVLEGASAHLAARAGEIAAQLTAEEGKPAKDALAEASRTPKNLELYAGEAIRLRGDTFPADEPGTVVYTRHDPLGVVGVITPWNFPLNIAARKIGPALAAGNTVVFKPSPLTPLMGERLAEAFAAAGLPAGVLNVVHGWAAGAHLVADDRVDGITFTGSNATGERIHAALGLGRRGQLELGGNNPLVVLADADIAKAAQVVAASAFNLTGQACTGAGRILVEGTVHDELVERVVELAGRHLIGPGDEEGVTLGPLVEQRALEEVHAAVEASVAAGATLACGGQPIDREGWFYPPTLLVDVKPDTPVAAKEVFGPVVGVEVIDGLEEGIARGNATSYGLTAAICTKSLAAAQRFAAEIQAGMVRINRPTVGAAFNAPFGGIKGSGTGTFKEQLGPGVMEFFTTSRTIFLGS